MSDRGSCKVFSPNIFNPTKCQNCYKPKEGHPSGSSSQTSAKIQRGMSLPVNRDRNTTTVKTVLKEGYLSLGTPASDGNSVHAWEKRYYVLYSSGELEEFSVEDGEVMRNKSIGVIVLQDFIRMLDGSTEINEENSLGLKSLKDGIYLKAGNKVDFENWWKELSTFVPSPMKRAYSSSAASKPQLGTAKPWLNKTYSSPNVIGSSKTAASKSSPLSTPQSEDTAQVDGLNSKISKLQLEVSKIPKLEEERRKLELEVNYWKEYVTNANSMKRSGGKADTEKALNEARIKIIDYQDQINEAEKEKRNLLSKISQQDKKRQEETTKLEEAKNLINVYVATISDLKSQLAQKKEKKIESKDAHDGPPSAPDVKPLSLIAEERAVGTLSPLSDSSDRGETTDLEAKFIHLKEKMKRIEKELFLKSKELEKANESRSKVAKYTRTLLQELEAKLNDTQRKMLEASERLSDTTMELEMERERRRRLESEREMQALSRNSSVSSTLSEQSSFDNAGETQQLGEAEVSSRYVDYYRSRFREAEAARLERDKKLSESQTKYKELEAKYKNVLKQCRSLDDIQIKLSEATHKLSDRQLKIHELTREVEKLRGYERGYDRKSKELQISTNKANELEQQLSELKKKLTVQERELEGFKIREVVMKERLTEFEEESSDEDAEEEEDVDGANDSRLERSIEAKARVEKTVDLEGQVRLLENENEQLTNKINELEGKLQSNDGKARLSDEISEETEDTASQRLDSEELQKRVEELESKLITEEDKFYTNISELKEKHKVEMDTLRTNNRYELMQLAKLKEEHETLKKELDSKSTTDLKDGEDSATLSFNLTEMKEQIERTNEKLSEHEKELIFKDDQIQNLIEVKKKLNVELENKVEIVNQLTERLSKTELLTENVEQLQKKIIEKDVLLQSIGSENAKLREDLFSLQKTMIATGSQTFGIATSLASDENQISVSQEIPENKSLSETESGLKDDSSNLQEMLFKSQSLKLEYKNQLDEAAKKYFESEKKVAELAENLQSQSGMEQGLKDEIMAIQLKIETMRKQLIESQDVLQSKSLELEKERNNISHLADVTSAYIKELENSLSESQEKIDELQNVIEETKNNYGKRMPPEGRSEKDREDSLSDQSDVDVSLREKEIELEKDRLVTENQDLKAKILDLESEVLKIKTEESGMTDTFGNRNLDVKDGETPEGLEGLSVSERPTIQGEKKEDQDYEDDVKQLSERIRELEDELAQTAKMYTEELKKKEETHAKLVDELREDFERNLAETIQAVNSAAVTQNTTDLQERIKELEKEQEELKARYEDELEAEKEAHQVEMEETIRDMLTVTEVFKSGKYSEKEESEEGDSHTSQRSSRRSSVVSTDGMEEIRKEYDRKMTQKERECEKEVEGIKRDMLTVIEAMQHGGASSAILEITNKNQVLRKEFDALMADFEIEREDLKLKIERLESNNFFGLRRNEEMGSKIFQMQTELEELERKHKLELEVYKNEENSEAILELVKVNEDLERKIKNLELELQETKEKHVEEMELLTMKVQEEKRVAISEMTDTVLNLEGIIDEMKDSHEMDIKEFEERSREEKLQAVDHCQSKVEDLELLLSQANEEHNEKIAFITEEHERELQELRKELETQVEYYKKLSEEKETNVKIAFQDDNELKEKHEALEMRIRDSESAWEQKINEMQTQFARDTEAKQKDFDNQINDIRSEYEEKLKSCIKESARRHSVSSRKTESQKNKELSSRVVELELALEEQQKDYQVEIEDYKHIIDNFQALVSELRGGQQSIVEEPEAKEKQATASIKNDSKTARVEALESQIQGYEKRIEYYKKKAERDEESENSRVSELQEEVHGLRNEMKALTERYGDEAQDDSVFATESDPVLRRRSETSDISERRAAARQQKHKRWSDLHLTDMVITHEGIEQRKAKKEREPWKRWSDLQLKQDTIVSKISDLDDKRNPRLQTQIKRDEIAKSGSVAHRKKLWENSGGEESRRIQRPLSSIRP